MSAVVVDWSQINSRAAFFELALPQLGAPEWHGKNLDALSDSVIGDDLNELKSPYTVQFRNADKITDDLLEFSRQVSDIFAQASEEHAVVVVQSAT